MVFVRRVVWGEVFPSLETTPDTQKLCLQVQGLVVPSRGQMETSIRFTRQMNFLLKRSFSGREGSRLIKRWCWVVWKPPGGLGMTWGSLNWERLKSCMQSGSDLVQPSSRLGFAPLLCSPQHSARAATGQLRAYSTLHSRLPVISTSVCPLQSRSLSCYPLPRNLSGCPCSRSHIRKSQRVTLEILYSLPIHSKRDNLAAIKINFFF